MRRFLLTLGLALLLVGAASRPTPAEPIVVVGDPGDFELVDTPSGTVGAAAILTNTSGFRLFNGFASPGHNIVFIFDLRGVPTGVPLLQADLTASLENILNFNVGFFGGDPFSGDLYGLGFGSSPLLPLDPTAAYFADAAPGPPGTSIPPQFGLGVLIQNDFVNVDTLDIDPNDPNLVFEGNELVVDRFIGTSPQGAMTLANFINANRPSGPNGDFLFLRISQDVNSFLQAGGYYFYSADPENANVQGVDRRPRLTLVLVPEPSTFALVVIGACFVGAATRRRARPAGRSHTDS